MSSSSYKHWDHLFYFYIQLTFLFYLLEKFYLFCRWCSTFKCHSPIFWHSLINCIDFSFNILLLLSTWKIPEWINLLFIFTDFKQRAKVKVSQSCPTLCHPMNYTAHGILQARVLEWVALPFSRRSFQPRSPALQADYLPA